MRLRIVLAQVILAGSLAAGIKAQEPTPAPPCTDSWLIAKEVRHDGTWWLTLRYFDKYAYAVGFLDAMHVDPWMVTSGQKGSRKAALDSREDYVKSWLKNVTRPQVVEGLNQFYSDSRNRRILIFEATWPVLWRIGGVPDSLIQSATEGLRKMVGHEEYAK